MPRSLPTPSAVALALVVATALPQGLAAQSPAGYLTPPQPIVQIMDAVPLPGVVVSPSRDVIALVERPGLPPIAEVAQPMLRLAGLRINPRNNGPHRTSGATGITLRAVATGQERALPVPADARIGAVLFSPDGKYLAFTNARDEAIDLHIVEVASGQSRRVTGAAVNEVSTGCEWLDDSSALLCGLVPASRGAAPTDPGVPAGPNIQENQGRGGAIRTYQDMLSSAHDEALFEYHMQTQLALIDARQGTASTVGTPGLIDSASASPDGRFVLVSRLKRPFSRLLPAYRFPHDVEIWSRAGAVVRQIADVPMGDGIPINGVITGPRSHRWVPVEPATVVWAEALDGGDLKNDVPHRDSLQTLAAPFSGQPSEVAKTEYRYAGASWTDQGSILLAESDRDTRTTRTWVLTRTWSEPRQLWDRKQQDRYADPGRPVMRPGRGTILQDGTAIYLTGYGASPDGDRPFLDRLDLTTFATARLFQSGPDSYESVVALLTDDAGRVMTSYETRTEPPNYYVRTLPGDARQAVTAFADPHPQITRAMTDRKFVTYERKDGVGLSGTLYLPAGYRQGERVPMLVWAYPQEFVDADAASQVIGSPHRFTFVRGASHLLLLAHGYAIFDGPTMPIVGRGETANDSYVEQLVASAQAAVDKAVDLGIADRHRVGVGGHSYGAFMTANLLAHSDIFAAGVARSGAYNRTLTPFGFQAEARTYWEVPQVYLKMSPFNYAHAINEPVLLIHGEADNNSGTFPIQSERMYMALKGHGATVRYVTLPAESHGYAARESNLHVVAETINWLDRYVKAAVAPQATPD